MKRTSSRVKIKLVVFAVSFCLLGATVYALTYRPQLNSPTIQLSEPVVQAPAIERRGARQVLDTDEELLSWGTVVLTPQAQAPELEAPRKREPRADKHVPEVNQGGKRRPSSSAKPKPVMMAAAPRARDVRHPADSSPAPGTGVMASFEAEAEDDPEQDEEEEVEQAATMPEIPRREEVAQVMNSIRRLVQRCYDTSMVPGQVDMTLTVEGPTGKVIKTQVSERSSTAICIRRLARTLRFPQFSRPQITIEHPYTFR